MVAVVGITYSGRSRLNGVKLLVAGLRALVMMPKEGVHDK